MFESKTWFSCLVLCTFIGSAAFAGGTFNGTRDGGGGVGVRCPAGSSAPKPFELLDLQEARLSGLKVNDYPNSQEKSIQLAGQLFANQVFIPRTFTKEQFQTYIVDYIVRPLFEGKAFDDGSGVSVSVEYVDSLPLATDIGPYNTLPNCTLEQVAYFTDATHVLKIVKAKWDELDWLNKSALVAHELVYFFNRHGSLENFGVPEQQITSAPTRRFVGQLFSLDGVTPRFDGEPSTEILDCSDASSADGELGTRFFGWDTGKGDIAIQFQYLHSLSSSYQTSASLPGTDVRSWWSQPGSSTLTVPLKFVDEADAPSISVRFTKVDYDIKMQAYLSRGDKQIPLGAEQTIACTLNY